MRGPTRIFLTLACATSILATAASTRAQGVAGPCDIARHGDETVRLYSMRLIRCAADRWPVPGGAEKAICIADVESHLNPKAKSTGGEYLGLFQHSAEAWPDRYQTWTRRAWELDPSALSGRTNAIVTIRMVNANGWGAWSGVGGC